MHVTQMHCCMFGEFHCTSATVKTSLFPNQEFTSSDCKVVSSNPFCAWHYYRCQKTTEPNMFLTQICSTHQKCILTANLKYPEGFSNSSNTILGSCTVWAHFHIMQSIFALFFIKSVITAWLEEKSTYGSSQENERCTLQSYSE